MNRIFFCQDGRIVLMNRYERISCHHFVEIDGYAYFSNWFYNGLFQVELKTGKTLFLGTFKEELENEFNVHWELLHWENLIYFLPRNGRHVHIYSPSDHSISAVETRKASEGFFRVGEVLADGMNLTLLSLEDGAPIRQFNLCNRMVTDVTNMKGTFKGEQLSHRWETFPDPQLLEKYQIERADQFSWKKMPDGRWCAFLPWGRHLLWYMPETQKIEKVPLTIVNEEKLNLYLQQLLQKCLSQERLVESKLLDFHDYLNVMTKYGNGNKDIEGKTEAVGQSIWHLMHS